MSACRLWRPDQNLILPWIDGSYTTPWDTTLEGLDCAICTDPQKAVQMVIDLPSIGLVVTDLRMANLDGASLIRHLRSELPANRHVDFIILTGDASSPIGEDIAHVPVFIKPADTDALVASIKGSLARAR